MTKLPILPIFLAGIALSGSAFAQVPPPPVPASQIAPPSAAAAVTQTSRIRAFHPGPGGQVDGLYLANGSVVDLSPDLGPIGSAVRKGERVSVSGVRTDLAGQTVIVASSVTVGGQTFVARPGSGLAANMMPPAPGGPDAPPARRGGPDVARLGPNGPEPRDRSHLAGPPAPGDPRPGQAPPPPPPAPPAPGVRPGTPDGVPPPPPPENGGRPTPPPPPATPGQPAAPVPPAGR